MASNQAKNPTPPVSICGPGSGCCAASRMAARQNAVSDNPSASAAARTSARSSAVSARCNWTASRMADRANSVGVVSSAVAIHLGALLQRQADVQLLARHGGAPASEVG